MIRADGVDILVDLAGHTADNRLLALAYKAAPVQMTYLGYPDTTGMSTVDYRITDALADPPGTTEAFHTEQLLRLDGGFLCYLPPDVAPEVGALPALEQGHVTFGCFSNIFKVTPQILPLWARILGEVPGSRLLLKDKAFASASTRGRVIAALQQAGIEPGRVELLPFEHVHQNHLALYRRVDVALDTFPYCGTTTTCDALWMGVPVVSMTGRNHASRVGLSLLNAAGMPELAGSDEREYVEIAKAVAGDFDKLEMIRDSLRQRMRQSRLLDAPAFTRGLEAAYRSAWCKWCSADSPAR
jgi:protein O-GlcNAc transferase